MRIDVHIHHHHHDRPVMDAVDSLRGAVMARFDNLDAVIDGLQTQSDALATDVDEIIAELQANSTPDTSAQEARLGALRDGLAALGSKMDEARAAASGGGEEPPTDGGGDTPAEPPA